MNRSIGIINMILRRLGNKARLAEKIYSTFPKHDVYLEPFFGTGAMYFSKPKAMHNIVNDIDDNVFNLWDVYTHKWDELFEAIQNMPKSESLFNHWKGNTESDPVLKALRFLMLSNFSYMGKSDCFLINASNSKKILLENYVRAKGLLDEVIICNSDFRRFFKTIQWASFFKMNNFTVVSYNDPPYLGTTDNYSHSFNDQDWIDVFDKNFEKSIQYPNKYFFAISAFKNPFILEQAKSRNLNVIEIGERRNLGNRNTEILICNYEVEPTLFSA